MRRSLSFPCEGETLLGTVDNSAGRTGVLIVTGGRQTRVGPHRLMANLARQLSAHGHPLFRFDRRGVGDSSGHDPGFRATGPDIGAAVAAFRQACPHLERLWGLGLCDGASALALNHHCVTLDGLILLNPWVIEADAGSPAPQAVRALYRERLFTIAGWRKLLTQGFSPRAAIRGVRTIMSKSDQGFARDVMTSLAHFRGPTHILLARRDATARAFLSVYQGEFGAPLRRFPQVKVAAFDSASHSFAGAADHAWLKARILAALGEN